MEHSETADRLAIAELLATYSDALSAKDFDKWQSAFAPDGVADYTGAGGVKGTPAECRAWLETVLAGFDFLHYTVANVIVRFDVGVDRATVTSAFHGTMRIPGADGGSPVHMRVGGNYNDTVVRSALGWRIASRTERFGFAV